MERLEQTTEADEKPQRGLAPLSLQDRTFLVFTELYALERSWAQKLILCVEQGELAPAVGLAVVALGGTCLMLDSDRSRLQVANRAGATDFTVMSFTEALRILKNELRKGSPVSVGVAVDPKQVMQEMVHRGVQPDAAYGSAEKDGLLENFLFRGALKLALPIEILELRRGWQICKDEAVNTSERRTNDARIKEALSIACEENRSEWYVEVNTVWMRTALRLFPRDCARVYWKKAQ